MNEKRTGTGDAIDLERGQYDARDVLLLRPDFERGGFCLFLHEICDVARGVGDLRKGEGRKLHHPAHLPLRLCAEFHEFVSSALRDPISWTGVAHFVNFTQDGTEPCGECVALFGEQRVAGLRTLETGFGVRECHPGWED